jgi:hypothetical protein
MDSNDKCSTMVTYSMWTTVDVHYAVSNNNNNNNNNNNDSKSTQSLMDFNTTIIIGSRVVLFVIMRRLSDLQTPTL